jgi:hypothetical protein
MGAFLRLAFPGIVLLTLENLNQEVLVLLAGFLGDNDILAACVMLTAFG